jgi:hypothetical protein
MRPLQLMRAAAWFVGRRWPVAGTKRLRQQPLPPLDCVRDGCPARVPARAMFGWVATACGRLASAPGNVLVSDRATWRLAGWVMECVAGGGVRRVQVQPLRRAAVSRHMCVFCNRRARAPRARAICLVSMTTIAICLIEPLLVN